MTKPQTFDELVAELRDGVESLRSEADRIEVEACDGWEFRVATRRDCADLIERLLPEPIKVGDRVRQWVIDDLMNYVETHQRYRELTTREVVAEAFGVVFNGDGGALEAFQRVLGDDFILHAADGLRPPAPAPSDTEQPEPVECSNPEALDPLARTVALAAAALDVVAVGGNGEGWTLDDVVVLLRIATGQEGADGPWADALEPHDYDRARSIAGSAVGPAPSGSTPGGAA